VFLSVSIDREKGEGYTSKSSTIVMQVILAMTAMAPQFAYIMNRKPDSNVLRIHILHVMKGSHAVASLAIIWVTHNYGKFKISIAIPK